MKEEKFIDFYILSETYFSMQNELRELLCEGECLDSFSQFVCKFIIISEYAINSETT